MFFRSLIALFLALLAIPAIAQDGNQIVNATRALDAASRALQAIDASFDQRNDAAARRDLRDRASAVRQAVGDAVATLDPQLALIDARVTQLGEPTPGVTEAPDIREQRRLLAQQRSTIDSAIKRGRLIGVEAGQLVDEINQSNAQAFGERMSAAVASPLSPGFWRTVLKAAPRDIRRVTGFVGDGSIAVLKGVRGGGMVSALVGLAIGFVLLFPVRLGLRRLGRRRVIEQVPGRVRRSIYALWLTAIGTLAPGFAAVAAVQGATWGGMLSPGWALVATDLVRAAFVSGFVTALGGALLLRHQPSWRLLPIADETAGALRPWTWGAAATGFTGIVLIGFNDAVGASYAAREAADGLLAIIYVLLIAGTLFTIGRLRAGAAHEAAAEATAAPGRQTGIALASVLAWLLTGAAVIALLCGYINLALFTVRFVVWLAIVAAALYLLLVAADDIITTQFSGNSRLGHGATNGLGLRTSTIDQFGVVLSAVVRLILVALAVSIVVRPDGSNLGSLFDQASVVAQGITIGQITISPGAIIRAVLVLMVGLFVVRGIQKWLTNRYLPTTALDAGARNSISMVARYMGIILASLWALASLGIGVERIALLLSALSVGIGFGLQAITQNFVSGLILLFERPVKIGDLVRIGTDEGDVKRISVRATEIQIADRSTLIVPNSELITKTIRNMTLADPIGRVQLQFSVQIEADIAQVRTILQAMFAENEAVLDDPEPKIFIDSIADGRVNFNCFAYVASPRAAYPTRSELLFRLLDRLPAAGIDLNTARQQLELVGPDISGIAPPDPAPSH